jgi:GAF domain-containing protein
MQHGSSAEVPDIRLDPRIPQDAYQPTFVKSLVMVPVGAPATAAIGVYWSGRCNARTRRLVETLARCAGLTISTIRLQEALAQNQERTMIVLEQANMGTWSLDMEELTLSTSLACRSLLAWQSHHGFAYPDLLAALDERSREQLKSCISELAARGGQFEMEALTQAADPTPRKLVISGYAEPSLDAPAQRIAGFCREAT